MQQTAASHTSIKPKRIWLKSILDDPDKSPIWEEFFDFLSDFSLDSAKFFTLYGESPEFIGTLVEEATENPLAHFLSFAIKSMDASTGISTSGSQPAQLSSNYSGLSHPAEQALGASSEARQHILDFFSWCSTRHEEEFVNLDREESWNSLDPQTLRLESVGTSSVILSCESNLYGPVIVKLLHPYFQAIDQISEDARNYKERVDFANSLALSTGRPLPVAKVFASTSAWSIQEHIYQGVTLKEVLNAYESRLKPVPLWHLHRTPTLNKPEKLRFTAAVTEPLLDALSRLNGTHEDLNPGNIIITGVHPSSSPSQVVDDLINARYPSVEVKLIDVGKNHLATDVIGRVTSPDRMYVAPEVRRRRKGSVSNTNEIKLCDLFSVGVILSHLAGSPMSSTKIKPSETSDIVVPASLFSFDPVLARIVVDMTDSADDDQRRALLLADVANTFSEPENRLHKDYHQLGRWLLRLIHEVLIPVAETEKISFKPTKSTLAALRSLRAELLGQRFFRNLVVDQTLRPKREESPSSSSIVFTRRFSSLYVVRWISLTLLRIVIPALGLLVLVLAWDPSYFTDSISNFLSSRLDSAGYEYRGVWGPITGTTFAFPGAAYTAQINSFVSFRGCLRGSVFDLLSIYIRLTPFLMGLAMAGSVILSPGLWIIWSGIGMLVVTTSNFSLYYLASKASHFLGQNNLKIYPPKKLASWAKTSSGYSLSLVLIGLWFQLVRPPEDPRFFLIAGLGVVGVNLMFLFRQMPEYGDSFGGNLRQIAAYGERVSSLGRIDPNADNKICTYCGAPKND